MLFRKFDIGIETVALQWKAGKRSLAVIACASVLAGCSSMPTFSEMGDGISKTYSEVEASVLEKYNETFASNEEESKDATASAQEAGESYTRNVALSRWDVRRLQGKLAKLEYRPGPVDGVMGSQTVKAIRRYQAANRLPVTGKVSQQFLAHLDKTYASATSDQTLTNSPVY